MRLTGSHPGALEAKPYHASHADFLDKPTIEGVRSFILLVQWWMSEGARYAEAALSAGVAVVSGCFDLQLHRDPDEVEPDLPPYEAEVRRRIFWTLYVFEAMVRPMLGKAWQPFDEDDITTRMPGSEEPGSTGALYRAAVLNARITRLVSRPKSLSASAVTTLLDELEKFLDVHRENALAVAMARFSYNRLHRFAYPAGLSTAKQDETATQVLCKLLDVLARRRDSVTDSPRPLQPACSTQSDSLPACRTALQYFSSALSRQRSPQRSDSTVSDFAHRPRTLSARCLTYFVSAGTSYALASTSPIGQQLYRLLADLPSLHFPPGHVRLVRRASNILSSLLPMPEQPPPFNLAIYSQGYTDLPLGPYTMATPNSADDHCVSEDG